MEMRVYATLRDLLGGSRFTWQVSDGATIKDVLERLTAEKPALNDKLWTQDHQLTGFIHVFVNGRAIQYLDGLDTPVADTDIISLFPPVGGG